MKIAQMLALALLLGSIPFRYWIEKRADGAVGWMALAFALDAAKGFVPVYLASGNLDSGYLVALMGLAVVLSDAFPYWLMFKPVGLGVVVAFGVLAGLNPLAAGCALGVWLLVYAISRRAGISTIVAAISASVWLRVFSAPVAYIVLALAGCGAVIITYASDISHLLTGAEPGSRKDRNNLEQ